MTVNDYLKALGRLVVIAGGYAAVSVCAAISERDKRKKLIKDLEPSFEKLNNKIDILERKIEELEAKEA